MDQTGGFAASSWLVRQVARFGLQSALLSIHSEQEHDPNNKKAGQRENGNSVRAGQLDNKGKGEGAKNRSEL